MVEELEEHQAALERHVRDAAQARQLALVILRELHLGDHRMVQRRNEALLRLGEHVDERDEVTVALGSPSHQEAVEAEGSDEIPHLARVLERQRLGLLQEVADRKSVV